MENKTWLMLIVGVLVTGAYLILSSLVKDTETIWLLTRLFGLIAFLVLFLVVLLGELRLLAKNKASVTLFRYHKPLAIFATYLVLLHFISAVADNYKWGRGLSFTQYLGFSFSDQWLMLLSLGTIAFYLMIIIGATSATKSIQLLGFKKWKLIHFLSYLTFTIAFFHAVNLGTDIKHSVMAPVLNPIIILMFAFVTGLLLVRVIGSFGVFEDQWEVNLAAALVLLIIILGGMILQRVAVMDETLKTAQDKTAALQDQITAQQTQVDALAQNVKALNDTKNRVSGTTG